MEKNNQLETIKDEIIQATKKIVVEAQYSNPTWLTAKEFMKMFCVSRNTVQNYMNRGLPYRQFTAKGKIYIKLSDAENFLNKGGEKVS